MKNTILTLALFIFIFASCKRDKNWNTSARFPDTPVNLADLNSPYDDFNSVLPETHFGKAIIFSTNKFTGGGEFDLTNNLFHAAWYWEGGTLTVDDSYYRSGTYSVAQLTQTATHVGNQFGPYCIGFDTIIDGIQKRINLLAYSSNNGSYSYQEEFVFHVFENMGDKGIVSGPYSIVGISDPEKQYISFYGDDVLSIDSWQLNPNNFSQMYFNKTVTGKSHIFRINIPDTINFLQFLSDSIVYQQEEVMELNSEGNDFCPFVNGNYMVFASDRAGGFGGYDLYYSYFDGTSWTEPVNFGGMINTEYDEFRPVPVQVDQFKNDLMIFSSNRPGGYGRFDLYYVGINKINPPLFPD